MFYRIHRKSQMFSYLLICPVPAGKHRDGIFQRCQKIRHCFLHLWVMDFHPAAAESDYPVHQFLIDLSFLAISQPVDTDTLAPS